MRLQLKLVKQRNSKQKSQQLSKSSCCGTLINCIQSGGWGGRCTPTTVYNFPEQKHSPLPHPREKNDFTGSPQAAQLIILKRQKSCVMSYDFRWHAKWFSSNWKRVWHTTWFSSDRKGVWRHMVLLWEWGKQLALKCKWSAPYGAVPSNRQRQVVGKFFFFGQINLIRIKLHDHSWLFHQSLKKLAVVERLFDSWGHSLVVVALVERWPFLRSLFWSESSLV